MKSDDTSWTTESEILKGRSLNYAFIPLEEIDNTQTFAIAKECTHRQATEMSTTRDACFVHINARTLVATSWNESIL